MRVIFAFLCVVVAALALPARDEADELPAAAPCFPALCQLPNCRCSSTDTPGGLAPKDTPQFVLVTFNDAVDSTTINHYRRSIYSYVNPNGCYGSATFFVPHEWNDYMLVNELYNYDMEIALHSITRNSEREYWTEASVDTLDAEFGDQRIMMAHFANIPIADIQGMRQPFYHTSGNNTFAMMKKNGLTYDMSWTTESHEMWPYTTDYLSTQDCNSPPCMTASVEGTWVVPMSSWLDSDGQSCVTLDTCEIIPEDVVELYELMLKNFEQHYLGSRAPFSINLNSNWFHTQRWGYEAYARLLNHIRNLEDVYLTTPQKVIEWTKNPIPLSEIKTSSWSACPHRFQPCNMNRACDVYNAETERVYWMIACASFCPAVHPWLNNPLGLPN